MTYFFPMIVEYREEEKLFRAYFPDLQGCEVTGCSMGEVADLGRKTLGAYLCEMEEKELTIPVPSPENRWKGMGLQVCAVGVDMEGYRWYRSYKIGIAEEDRIQWTHRRSTVKSRRLWQHLFGSSR